MDAEPTISNKITLNEFRMWSESSLKSYLTIRKKSIDGDFETLLYM